MGGPEAGIPYVAGNAREDVERTCGIALKLADVAAVTVRVEMGRQDDVDADLVENRHERFPFSRKAVLPVATTYSRIEGVLQRILVHDDDFPFLVRLSSVVRKPGHFVGFQGRLELFHFRKLRVQADKVDVAVIEGIELVLVFLQAVIGQGEVMYVGFGEADLPVAVVRFVIARNGCNRNGTGHLFNGTEPGAPLIVVLAVIDEVAHVDVELGVLVAFIRRHGRITSDGVVTGLGIGEDEGLKIAALCRVKRIPVTPFVAVTNAVLIRRTGL
jgi:hypothetical protein